MSKRATARVVADRILSKLGDFSEGSSVTHLANQTGIRHTSVSSALQRLRRRGLAERGHGYMGWSWWATPEGVAHVIRMEEER